MPHRLFCYLVWLCSLITPIHAAVHLRLGAETQSLYTAFDCVNVVTGEYFETHDDVIIDGPFPLHFTHCLECGPGINKTGWKGVNQFLQFPMHACTTTTGMLAVNQREGAYLSWKRLPSGTAEVSPEVYTWGYTNYGGGDLSGRTHLRNACLSFPKNDVMHVRYGSGLLREYHAAFVDPTYKAQVWLLQREDHPDGHLVHFQYAQENQEAVLKEIRTTNSAQDLLFNSLTITRDPDHLGYTVQGSNGQKTHYQLQKVLSYTEYREKIPGCSRYTEWVPRVSQPLRRVERFQGPSTTYTENPCLEFGYNKPNPSWLHTTRNLGENGQYRAIEYNNLGSVSKLQSPLGNDSSPITYATFDYTPQGTAVYDAYGHKTFYRLTAEKRVTAIERYQQVNGQHELYSSQQFRWGESGVLLGNLLTKGVADDSGNFLHCTVGTYDARGNVVKEELFGNLTGCTSGRFSQGKDHRPIEPTECYTICTTYSEDGYNLPLKEIHGDGKVIRYAYEPQSNRRIATLTGDAERIWMRQFHRYNSDGILVETIHDDGVNESPDDLTGVTTRTLTRIQPRHTAPAVGLSDTVVEQYWDSATGTEKQLKRTQYLYNSADLIEEETVYDANDQLRYSLHYVYDAKGNLTAKSDPLGRITRWTYDENKNKTSEELIGSGFCTRFRYDMANRLISKELVHDDGICLITSYRYDYLGQKVAEIDSYGNETTFEYDGLGRQIAIQLPKQATVNGVGSSVTRKTYNLLDQLISMTDANGNTTHTEYNLRNQPTLVVAPDGTQQRREYNLNGSLKTLIEPNGLVIHHEYDILGRLLTKTTCDPQGTVHAILTYEFQGAQLIRATDALGIVTAYGYDGAGRKIRETCQDARIDYEYDALGRVSLTRRWMGPPTEDYIALIEERDVLDRIVELRVEDAKGVCHRKEIHDYDILGHCTHNRISVSEDVNHISETRYNSRKLPVQQIDALGNTIQITYDMQHRNAIGQRVLLKTITDPLGKRTFLEHDAAGRKTVEWVESSSGMRLAHSRICYDLVGNCTQREEMVLAEGAALRNLVTTWDYDSCNRLTCIREAVGTGEERTTRREYNDVGQLGRIQLPGGITLTHQYDALGRLSDYTASDNSIGYRYTYDAANNLLSVEDLVNANTTRRHYDGRRRLTSESLGNGLTLNYRYDALDRMTWAQLPDQSTITWVYDSVNLSEIQRWNSSGSLNYRHVYVQRDRLGRALEETLLGYAGTVQRTFDALGRQVSYQSNNYNELIPQGGYDAVGNLLQRDISDSVGNISCRYQYNALYQLTQEEGACQHQYRQDSLHNRTCKDTLSSTVNALNALLDAGNHRFTYDAQGFPNERLGEDGMTTYRYDALGRLLEVANEQGREVYQYDSFHRRVWAGDKRMLYIGQNEIGAVDSSGAITELRVLGDGRGAEIGAAVAMELQGYVYAVHHDSSGNVVALVNRLGYTSESYRYSAYGEEQIINFWGQRLAESRLGNPWRFSSKRTDDLTGLIYFGRRYYQPENGRWLTPDPLGYDAGPNLYAYVQNNPLTHVDLYGLFALPNFDCTPNRYMGRGMFSSNEGWGSGSSFFRLCDYGAASISRGIRATSDFFDCRTRASGSCRFVVPGIKKNGVRLTWINGIDQTYEESYATAKFYSETHGGHEVLCTYNKTDGRPNDWARVGRMALGYGTDAVDVHTRTLVDAYFAASIESSKPNIISFGHSQGATVLSLSLENIPTTHKAMHIRTLGGTTMITGSTFGSVENIVSTHDYCSMLACPWETTRSVAYAAFGASNPNVRYVQGSGWYDHSVLGTTYRKVIRDHGHEFCKEMFKENAQ